MLRSGGKSKEESGFLQRGALLKEPVEADSRHPNETPQSRYDIHWQVRQAFSPHIWQTTDDAAVYGPRTILATVGSVKYAG